jgi:hypothetical protein
MTSKAPGEKLQRPIFLATTVFVLALGHTILLGPPALARGSCRKAPHTAMLELHITTLSFA